MPSNAIDIIRAKRDGHALTKEQIGDFITAASTEGWKDYQLSALLMAIWIRGMSDAEAALLTGAMTDSGKRYNWSAIPGPKVDKHSTGGVGDKTSLILAPLAAACGVIVPMMSGRGLGHTGGTLDKLESIPGFRVGLSEKELENALRTVGMGMIGQSADVAPADRKLYALRDVTGTVESIPLITSSILSKKLAEGIDALVMDVKFGVGAFIKDFDEAKKLARLIVSVGNANGVKTEALLTDMNHPLGVMIGNSLEVIESIDILKGEGDERLAELSMLLAARMVLLGGLAKTEAESLARVRKARADGSALERLRKCIEIQGGDPKVIDDYNRLPTAPFIANAIPAWEDGYVADIHAEQVARATMLKGAGRSRAEDAVDHAVGVKLLKHVGDAVKEGEPLFEVHSRTKEIPPAARHLLEQSVEIGDRKPAREPLVREVLS